MNSGLVMMSYSSGNSKGDEFGVVFSAVELMTVLDTVTRYEDMWQVFMCFQVGSSTQQCSIINCGYKNPMVLRPHSTSLFQNIICSLQS